MPETTSALRELGARLGLATSYTDFWGQTQELSDDALRALLKAMGIDIGDEGAVRGTLHQVASASHNVPPVRVIRQRENTALDIGPDVKAARWRLRLEDGKTWEGDLEDRRIAWPDTPPLGYHDLELLDADGHMPARTQLIVCPSQCFEPDGLRAGERWWGPTVQLYAIRSERNWGMGDFTDLLTLIDVAARQGAAFVGLNPLHALFPHEPERASPYSPSNRTMLNTMYIDVEAVPEFRACEAASELVHGRAFQRRLLALREAPYIDYAGVAAAKQHILGMLYAHFRREHLADLTPRGAKFRNFQQDRGRELRIHALFDTLQAHFHAQDKSIWGWTLWPQAYRDANGTAVQTFEQEHLVKIEYAEYLQWLADEQLESAQRHAQARGMPLGLYLDVAVGVNEGGAETWSEPDLYALGVHVGAPREEYNPSGQDWGLPPTIPEKLRDRRYKPFYDMLRANMRHAGALRLDHAMALARLFWVPPEGGAVAGTYMRYPLDDLTGILTLESMRNACLVIGEDLGTVPDGFRECMAQNNVFSYCPLYFERGHDGSFRAPDDWRPQALAVVGTHDLPTLRAYWRGDDIETRARLKLFVSADQQRQQVISRAQERVQLLLRLEAEGLWQAGSSVNPGSLDDADPRFTEAVYTLIGRSRAKLAGVQLEDVVQQLEQVNVPSTTEDQHPNWRVKLASTLEELQQDARWHGVCQALRQTRPRAGLPSDAGSGLPPLDTALIPRATYRVQFHAEMRFEQATRRIPYLAGLGISHLYASPYLRARAGSTHGYDIVDHNALNPEIGDEAAHEAMCQALREQGMYQLLDIVPNHMGVLEADNAWWQDVLECGPASRYVHTFDIEWRPPARELRGKVLLPVLGDHYGRILEAGELKLQFDEALGEFAIHYYGHRFPIDPRTYPDVFAAASPWTAASDASSQLEVQSLIDAFGRLPDREDADPTARSLRQRDKLLLKDRLGLIHREHEWLRHWIQGCLSALNGHAGEAASFDALDRLIDKQAYRLAFWRVAGDDVNYRRFFDVSTLAALRMDNPEVFEATHRTVMQWVARGKLAGLRVDHPDGLADPQAYFERLQRQHAQAQHEQGEVSPRALYIVVEKILADHERVPENWPVHGGTGYRFVNTLNGVFVDSAREAEMDAVYASFTGQHDSFDEILRECKLLIMSTSLASDLHILTEALHRIAQMDRRTRDFTRNRLRAALVEVTAGFPVYRSYITERGVSQIDRRHIAWACAEAKRRSPASELSAIDYVRDTLLNAPDEPDMARRQAMLSFAMRWQQFSAPVMAKAMEDTAFYRYHRLLSLNEVGGEPRRYGVSVAAFHAANTSRARFYPHTMLATSTHDTKRSEDVRARINVLSEMPREWGEALQRWRAMNRPVADRADAGVSPDDEYLLYQTLVGVWPLEPLTQEALDPLRERIQAYMLKAMREAKLHTSWINPNEAHESAMRRWIDRLLGVLEPNPFLKDLQAFVAPLIRLGCLNSLNQVVLKLTSPGVPDIYQGCEGWHFSLVDPDNRRPVDFERLQGVLREVRHAFQSGHLDPATLSAWLHAPAEGHIKMLLTWRLLALRAMMPRLFEKGAYRPLEVKGAAAAHTVAFMRMEEIGSGRACVVLSSRLLHRLGTSAWHDTSTGWTAPGVTEWADWLTGRRIGVQTDTQSAPMTCRMSLSPAFDILPMAVLVPAHWLDEPLPLPSA